MAIAAVPGAWSPAPKATAEAEAKPVAAGKMAETPENDGWGPYPARNTEDRIADVGPSAQRSGWPVGGSLEGRPDTGLADTEVGPSHTTP